MSKFNREAKRRQAEALIKDNPSLPVEQDPDKLMHMLGTDLRESIPPQLFALVARVMREVRDESN